MSAVDALNRLAKWRGLLAGWQLGTRPKGDPESDAVRDHREATLLLRAEVSALAGILLRKGLITADEWEATLEGEANALSEMLSQRFRGVRATDEGLSLDTEEMLKHGTMSGWRP